MLLQDAPHDILVDLEAEGIRNLLGDFQAPELRIAGFMSTTAATISAAGPFGPDLALYSIARDLVGNVENKAPVSEAGTVVVQGGPDTTPPIINPQVAGTLGNNGWHTSNVTVSWNVTDPESGIAFSTGCGSMTLTADTAGVTLTCSARNRVGLNASVPVTVKIDRTPPASHKR